MSAEPGDSAATAVRKARILIVEDEAWDAELAQRLLTSAGLDFTSVVVATRAPFEEQLAAFHPDVILSDYHLPGFSGEAALEIAQAQCPDVPFVFWSGVLGDEEAVALIKLGATDYVLKDRPAGCPRSSAALSPKPRSGRSWLISMISCARLSGWPAWASWARPNRP